MAQTLKDLAQYLEHQKNLGNREFGLSAESSALIEKWGTPAWRASHGFSCQGPKTAPLMIVDSEGLFFKGPAGELLVKILKAMRLSPDQVFICTASDILAIGNHVRRNAPKCMLCLGAKAGRLVNPKQKLTEVRGQFLSFKNTPVMVTHHPAALLKNNELKRQVWDDVQQVMARIGGDRGCG